MANAGGESGKTIWNTTPEVARLDRLGNKTLVEHLAIEVTEVGDNFVRGTMPVDHRTHQPMGLLHGGASVVLAESLGSMAGNCCVDLMTHHCVGITINASHMRSVRSGLVTGTARPLHLGSRTQVWQIDIVDEADRLVCTSRLTLAVVAH
jgi:1,4-dihydroxy-2-naphthoyl-CoA hydrolase